MRTSWNKGIKMSEDIKRKMSETKKRLHSEGKLFSQTHKENISKALKGRKLGRPAWNKGLKLPQFSKENHPNWKGGIKLDKDRRKSYECRTWREAVFNRDSYYCLKCFNRGGKLHPHHIKNYSQYPELRAVTDNGITLCVGCHKYFHKLFGNQNNNQQQLVDYLNMI
jgi:hypothetical protein